MSNFFTNPTTPMLLFVIITILYTFIRYNYYDAKAKSVIDDGKNFLVRDKDSIQDYHDILLPVFTFINILLQFLVNLAISYNLCGSIQWLNVLLATFLPWIFIYSIFIFFINTFAEGFFIPFEHTFGYLGMLAKNASGIANKILIVPQELDKFCSSTVDFITDYKKNKSLIFNEISEANIDNFFKEAHNLFNFEQLNNDPKPFNELIKIIYLKRCISEFVWLILVGFLTILISYNYIISHECERSVEQIKSNEEKKENDKKLKEKIKSAEINLNEVRQN